MDPHHIRSLEDDPRFQEEPQAQLSAEVARDRLVVPDTTQEEAKRLAGRVKKAQETVNRQIAVSVSPSGRLRKNGPCLCGSGRKFKKCCQLKIKDGFIPPVSLSGKPLPPTREGYATRKLRKAAECQANDPPAEADATTTETGTTPVTGSSKS